MRKYFQNFDDMLIFQWIQTKDHEESRSLFEKSSFILTYGFDCSFNATICVVSVVVIGRRLFFNAVLAGY